MDTTLLKEAGLTEGEIKVYTTLLKIGPSTTGPIIEESGVAKSIIYQLLEKLMQKGLVSYITQEKTKHFQASDPHLITQYIEERGKKLEKVKKDIEHKLMPSLLNLQETISEFQAYIYKGFKGMITVHEHTYERLKKGEDFFYLGIQPEQPKHFHAYWKKDHKRREKAGIKCNLLFHQDTDKIILKNRNSYKGCDARYMPININTPAWFVGYKNVAVIGFPSSDPVTLEIINKEIADSFKAYFEEFWKMSKPFKWKQAKP